MTKTEELVKWAQELLNGPPWRGTDDIIAAENILKVFVDKPCVVEVGDVVTRVELTADVDNALTFDIHGQAGLRDDEALWWARAIIDEVLK